MKLIQLDTYFHLSLILMLKNCSLFSCRVKYLYQQFLIFLSVIMEPFCRAKPFIFLTIFSLNLKHKKVLHNIRVRVMVTGNKFLGVISSC